jgi:hypothetical protein
MLETRLEAARARGLNQSQEAVAQGIARAITRAREAAFRIDPIPRRWSNWWRGTLVEAAHRNLHAARAQMVDVLDENEVRAEIPAVLARAESTLTRNDPRRVSLAQLRTEPIESLRPRLRRLMEDSYESLDGKHAQLRSFRNILLLTALFVGILVIATILIVWQNPDWIPLCFPEEDTGAGQAAASAELNCPTGTGVSAPSGNDILIVALLGALGGALAAALSIRNLKGTSTPYDVPVALSLLKVPLGAFTAILALVAIRGDFVPGLSLLDSQAQILAYALIFGFAQQLLTRLLDRQAQTLLEELPGGTAVESTPASFAGVEPPVPPQPPAAPERPVPEALPGEPEPTADLPFDDVDVVSSDEPVVEAGKDEEAPAAVVADNEIAEPDPLTGQGDDLQDDVVPEADTTQDDQASTPATSRRG